MVRALPATDPEGEENASHGDQRAPDDAALTVRRDQECAEERAKRRATVAAHLKDRLRESVLTARRQARNAR